MTGVGPGPRPPVPAPAGAAGGTMGFGLVGCGVIAETFAAALARLDNARLVAVHDVDDKKGDVFAAQHEVAMAGALSELLGRADIETVCVCVPSGLHAEVGLAVAGAGKHVVVEKPIDVTLAAARRLIEGAGRAGVSLHVISQQRYNPGVRRAKQLLDEGRLGRPLFVQARVPWYRTQAYYDSAEWRGTWALDGGGALMNQGVHYADLLCWLFGRPEVVAAACARLDHDIEGEDLATALLRFPDGPQGSLIATTDAFPGFPAVLSVSGTLGSLELVAGALVALELKDDSDLGPVDVRALEMPDGHQAQLADVVAAIQERRPPPIGGEDGYRALQLVLDVYSAAGWEPA